MDDRQPKRYEGELVDVVHDVRSKTLTFYRRGEHTALAIATMRAMSYLRPMEMSEDEMSEITRIVDSGIF